MSDQTEVVIGSIAGDFVLDANGDASFENGPALKIEIVHALGDRRGGKKKENGFAAHVEWIRPDGKCVDITPDESFRFDESAVWELAWDAARRVIYDAYSDALDSEESLTAIQLHAFRSMIGDRLQQKRDELDEKDVISFTWFAGGDLIQALRVLKSHFSAIDPIVPVAFRFRHSSAGEAWTKGLDEKGAARPCLFRLEPCGGEKVHAARLGLGYAPRFVVTCCASAWSQSSDKARFLILYDALSRIAWDSEKERAFICDPVGMTPGLAYEMERARIDGHAKRIAEKVAQAMVENGMQLDMLNETGAVPTVEALARTADRALQAYLSATKDDAHFHERNSATLALAAFKANGGGNSNGE